MTELEDLIRQHEGVKHHLALMENRDHLGEDGIAVMERLRQRVIDLELKIEAARQTL